MIIKKFMAKTQEDAVETAKKELGNGIVIMNVRNVKPKGLFGLFRASQTEVTVALEEERESLKKVERDSAIIKPSIEGESDTYTQQEKQVVGNIEKKLENLQSLLESQIKNKELFLKEEETPKPETLEKEEEEGSVDPEQEKFIRLLYNTMIDNEVDEKYANQMIEDMEKNKKPNLPMDFILGNIYQKMILKFGQAQGILPAQEKPKVVLFIGPTGVGKTTTIAKLASSFAVDQKKKIALLTTDTYRIAAAEQLRTYADILEVPFRVIYTEDDFLQAVTAFHEYDYIFVDTAGHSHQNAQQLGDMKSLITAIKDRVDYQCFLVMSATTKYRDLFKIAENYQSITEYQLIFTKLDETTTLGNLLNLKLATDTPIAYVTYGQNVPNDIEKFNPQKTVKMLLGGKN